MEGSNGAFLVFFHPAVRTGSSNTRFYPFLFFGAHLPQTSGFRSAKQILVASFATQVRARILGGRNIFCTLWAGQQRQGLMPLGAFLVRFLYRYVLLGVTFLAFMSSFLSV